MANSCRPDNPLIVQGDHTILAEVASPHYPQARDRLAVFAELVKAPEHVHTYRVTPLSVWNACAAGASASDVIETLLAFSKFPVPEHVIAGIRDSALRYGRLRLTRDERGLVLAAADEVLAAEIAHSKAITPFLDERLSALEFRVAPAARGEIKQALVKLGFPAEDVAGYTEGEVLQFALRPRTLSGQSFALRSYQSAAAEAFHAAGSARGGSGVISLPCGAGKTIVGMACMARLQSSTLILTTSVTAARQWMRELLDKTTLTEEQIAEYCGESKDVRPVTVATYQMMTWRSSKESDFIHLDLFDQHNWGLIIYDEVHLLPAPVFRVTAALQARRRLGLTATLVREDGREEDVFALIGPKKADVPWKVLESLGWIATARCTEVRLSMPEELRMPYAVADVRSKFRIAAENPLKLDVVRRLLTLHQDEPALVIAVYLDQLKQIAGPLGLPVLTGSTPQRKRDELFARFRKGHLRVLAVSKVANFAVDLPEASVAIQISGTFGSRQEEAQRLGRILRPKQNGRQAHFYSVISADTVEQHFALKRQLFLCEQGYSYSIVDEPPLPKSSN
ncbi:MAG: DNA repair helicase XPB [Terriglobia bacterium]